MLTGVNTSIKSNVGMGKTARRKIGLWVVPFVLGVPFALLFMAGELLAWPLEKHRHRSFPIWLLWNLIRAALPTVLLFLAILLLLRWRRH